MIKVSKEKTAKFIPNAVGLTTAREKHVFSSLLSRDTTFKFMTQVWKRAMKEHLVVREVEEYEEEEEEEEYEEEIVDLGAIVMGNVRI